MQHTAIGNNINHLKLIYDGNTGARRFRVVRSSQADITSSNFRIGSNYHPRRSMRETSPPVAI